MIILTGKSGSGKDLIRKCLVDKYKYIPILTYASRPKRHGEKDGVTYHFISEEEFKEKIEEGFFAEYKEYKVANGDTWYYGSSATELERYENEKAIIILTPDGVRDVKKNLDINATIIYLYANQNTLVERLNNRGDDKNEAERRRKHDDIDFKGWENEVDKIVYNNLGYDVDDILKKIVYFDEHNTK